MCSARSITSTTAVNQCACVFVSVDVWYAYVVYVHCIYTHVDITRAVRGTTHTSILQVLIVHVCRFEQVWMLTVHNIIYGIRPLSGAYYILHDVRLCRVEATVTHTHLLS